MHTYLLYIHALCGVFEMTIYSVTMVTAITINTSRVFWGHTHTCIRHAHHTNHNNPLDVPISHGCAHRANLVIS